MFGTKVGRCVWRWYLHVLLFL